LVFLSEGVSGSEIITSFLNYWFSEILMGVKSKVSKAVTRRLHWCDAYLGR